VRELFPEYYPLTDDQVRECVTAGLIVLDTNVLLDLYRLPTTQREHVLGLLEQVQDRVWVPHQVALEYQRTRESVLREQAGHYDSVVSLFREPDRDRVATRLRAFKIPDAVKDAAAELIDAYVDAVRNAVSGFVEQAEAITREHVVTREQAHVNDPVRARLDSILAGRVGEAPSDRDKRIKTALERNSRGVPPGFKDDHKANEEQRAGDYLVWSELLDHAKEQDLTSPVLFVTSDGKEDWRTRDGGPLPALRREFADHSGALYHQVSLADLLTLANQHLSATVPDDTIERANNIQLNGELRRKTAHFRVEDPEFSARMAQLLRNLAQHNPSSDTFRAIVNQNAKQLFTPEQVAYIAAMRPDFEPFKPEFLDLGELFQPLPSDQPIEYWLDDDKDAEGDDRSERDDSGDRDD
jgi:hypothetical protein